MGASAGKRAGKLNLQACFSKNGKNPRLTFFGKIFVWNSIENNFNSSFFLNRHKKW